MWDKSNVVSAGSIGSRRSTPFLSLLTCIGESYTTNKLANPISTFLPTEQINDMIQAFDTLRSEWIDACEAENAPQHENAGQGMNDPQQVDKKDEV